MAEFDDKLNDILSNPEAMAQIAQIAQSISASTPSTPSAPSPSNSPSLSNEENHSIFNQILPLIQELSGQQDSNARQLLYALRPYLKPQRQEKIERALQLAHLFHIGKKFFSELQ